LAKDVAEAHDRYDGDFTIESGRHEGAPSILIDQGDPFVSRPKSCVFRLEGRLRTFRLDWTAPPNAEVHAAYATFRRAPSKLGLQPWGDRRWWISVPSMSSAQDWKGFYGDVRAHLGELRTADMVVLDVRGNGGGDSGFGDRLARLLWGDAMIDAREPILGPTVYRVSRLNRDNWARVVETTAADPQYTEDDRAEFGHILSLYDAALARGDATFRLGDDAPAARPKADRNLVQGRVVVLTDYACVSACLDMMDEVMAMPRAVQAGTSTSADTIFMEMTTTPELPSGLIRLSFPHKAWVKRPRGSNVAYAPASRFVWTGSPSDDAGLRRWLAHALQL
jgi:hypothetical protein